VLCGAPHRHRAAQSDDPNLRAGVLGRVPKCHSGAAAFAAAALLGGIVVFGVAISAAAAEAFSMSLAAGAGVSALVAVYIC